MKKYADYTLRITLSIAVFALFMHTVPLARHVNGFISDTVSGQTRAVVLGEKAFVVEVADTAEKRTKGLSGRTGLETERGLLFVFDTDDLHGIWMKDMEFAIDIIWLNRHFEVVHIEKSVSPDTFPQAFRPDAAARFVIEVNAGFTDANNIKEGDLMTLL